MISMGESVSENTEIEGWLRTDEKLLVQLRMQFKRELFLQRSLPIEQAHKVLNVLFDVKLSHCGRLLLGLVQNEKGITLYLNVEESYVLALL